MVPKNSTFVSVGFRLQLSGFWPAYVCGRVLNGKSFLAPEKKHEWMPLLCRAPPSTGRRPTPSPSIQKPTSPRVRKSEPHRRLAQVSTRQLTTAPALHSVGRQRHATHVPTSPTAPRPQAAPGAHQEASWQHVRRPRPSRRIHPAPPRACCHVPGETSALQAWAKGAVPRRAGRAPHMHATAS